MFENNFRKPQPILKSKQEGCKIRIRRDSNGRIVGYSDNGLCSANQIRAFNEKLEDSNDKEEEE